MGWETKILSYREAQALSERRRAAGKAIDTGSRLAEVQDRDRRVKQVQRQQRQKLDADPISLLTLPPAPTIQTDAVLPVPSTTELVAEEVKPKKLVPYVRVLDYEQMRREAGLL